MEKVNRIISLSVGTSGAEDWFRTFQQVSEIATALDKAKDFTYISVSSTVADDDDEPECDPQGLYHDDNTLMKVRSALVKVLDLHQVEPSGNLVTNLIIQMQHEGILFREQR